MNATLPCSSYLANTILLIHCAPLLSHILPEKQFWHVAGFTRVTCSSLARPTVLVSSRRLSSPSENRVLTSCADAGVAQCRREVDDEQVVGLPYSSRLRTLDVPLEQLQDAWPGSSAPV